MRRSIRVITALAMTAGFTIAAHPAHAADAWTQQGTDIDGQATDDESGYSVAMSADGTTVAIGAPGNDGTAGNFSNAGQVRVYSFNGSTWVQQGNDIYGDAAGDLSGYSVAMSADGSTVAIGAPGNAGNLRNAGQVRVYSFNGSTWTQVGGTPAGDIYGDATDDESGWSVAMAPDGTTVAIGAPGNDGNGSLAGQVRVYSFNGSTWTQQGSDIDGEAAGDRSGSSVAMSADGTTVAIGAPVNDGNGGTSSDVGQVRVYSFNGSTWSQQGADIYGEAAGDRSGSSVAMSADGTTVAIGAPVNTGTNGIAGQVRVYVFDGSTWDQQGSDIDGEAARDFFGWSVAMAADGTTVAIGARLSDANGSDSGQVRVYSWPVATGGTIPGPATYFTFLLPDGRECTAISPQRVQVGTMVELPGVDALCQTMPGSTVAGWAIPSSHHETGYGTVFQPFPPGLKVRVIESQRFTLVPFEPIMQIDYDANITADDTCTPANLAHTSDDGRIAHSWVPREIFTMARTPTQAPCAPEGYELIGWNTSGDGTGTMIEPGAGLPDAWHEGGTNHHTLYAMWRAN